MKIRRQGGATLGLTAACVLLVILIGVGFFFLSKIIGGGREVANATDAGALNVARLALKRGTANLTVAQNNEFGSLTDPPDSGVITLITYNRIVAQAMMVAQNAASEGTTQAKTNATGATGTVTLANQVGQTLRTSLNTAAGGSLHGDFDAISTVSNTKMWNGNPVNCTAITPGFLKKTGSTNVIFDDNIVAALGGWTPCAGSDLAATNKPNNKDFPGSTVGPNGQYMPGYKYDNVLGISLSGVPVFPNTKPHLIDVGTFQSDLSGANAAFAADNNVPPNCFRSNAKAVEAKSGNTAATLACAVVGVLNKDFKASIPRGFVRISNGPDALFQNAGLSSPVSDGSNDIFNNQLYTGPLAAPGASGITQDGGTGIFTTTPSDLTAWSNFNSRSGMYDNSASPAAVPVMAAAGATGPAWVAFNVNSAGTIYPPGTAVPQADLPTFADPNIVGPAPQSISDFGANPGNYDGGTAKTGLRVGNTCDQYPTLSQMESIGGGNFNCNYTYYDDNIMSTHPQCGDTTTVNNWQDNYQCVQTLPSTNGFALSGPHQGVTNVEYLKAELLVKISGRLGGHYCADVDIPTDQPSGVKYFQQGVPGTPGSAVSFDPSAGGPHQDVNFEVVGSPYDYLTQITGGTSSPGSCGNGPATSIIEQITLRMQQIESTIKNSDVVTAMSSKTLHLKSATGAATSDDGTLYLYYDPSSKQVVMNPKLPTAWGADATLGNNAFPDGNKPTVGNGECYDQYPLNGWTMNTKYTKSGTGHGDGHYHDQPFTEPGDASGPPDFVGNGGGGPGFMATSDNQGGDPGPAVYGQDQALFTLSSGAQNNLGVLNFQENTQGTTFCKPN